MHELHELKEMLCKELEEYGKKGELSAGTLDIVDKLAHTIKNLDKIIEVYEGEDYSNAPYMRSYRNGRSYEDRSYARRRDGRYSSEGYSRNDITDRLKSLMHEAPDDRTRQEIQSLVSRMEMM